MPGNKIGILKHRIFRKGLGSQRTKAIGVIGLVLAAPVVATLKLLIDYVMRKMFDQDPFPDVPVERKAADQRWARATRRARD